MPPITPSNSEKEFCCMIRYLSILPLSTKLMARGNCDIWDALQWLRQQPFRICLLGVYCVVCSVKRMNWLRCLDQRSLDESTWQKAHVNLPNSSNQQGDISAVSQVCRIDTVCQDDYCVDCCIQKGRGRSHSTNGVSDEPPPAPSIMHSSNIAKTETPKIPPNLTMIEDDSRRRPMCFYREGIGG
jgi:hypothetical protein